MSESVKPDVVCELGKTLPFKDQEFDEIYFFHCIEHLEKWKHDFALAEIHRVLKLGGTLYLSYPEFSEIAKNWLENTEGKRKFWEATVFGRQLYPGDYHFSAMDTLELRERLSNFGFQVTNQFPEPNQPFNTVLWAERCESPVTYEELLYREIFAK